MNNVLDLLTKIGIDYQVIKHPIFDSVNASTSYHAENNLPGSRVKNLFLRNKKGDQHFLFCVVPTKPFDKALFKSISDQKCGFADNDRLHKYLGLKPGHVSPFGLMNDTQKQVQVFLDQDLLEYEYLYFHPNIPEVSIQMKPDDILKAIEHLGYEINIVEYQIP